MKKFMLKQTYIDIRFLLTCSEKLSIILLDVQVVKGGFMVLP